MKKVKRRLTEAEEKIAQKIADAIGWLDKLVFPGDPIKKITVIRGRPKSESQGVDVGYVSKENTEDGIEHYQIFGYGIDEEIKKELEKRIILLKGKKKINYQSLPKITLEELLIGIAAHEVRHRVQHHFPIELISYEILEDIANSYVKGLIEFIKLLFEQEPPEGDYKQEFDAKSIEYMIIEMWHWKEKEVSKIASIVKAGTREICPFDKA